MPARLRWPGSAPLSPLGPLDWRHPVRLLRRGPRWSRCGWPATMTRRCRPALGAWVGSRYAVSRPAVLAQPGYPRTGRQAGLSRLSPPVIRRSRPPSLRLPARCQLPVRRRPLSAAWRPEPDPAPAFINVQVGAPRTDHRLEQRQQLARSQQVGRRPGEHREHATPAPNSRASRCSTVPRQIPHVEGAFDVHVNPRPRSAGQRPRSWLRPITVSRETMSPPSGLYRRRPAAFIRLCVE